MELAFEPAKGRQNRRRVMELWKSLPPAAGPDELADRLLDQAAVHAICRYRNCADLLCIGYTLVFHRGDKLSALGGSHLSSPALLHQAQGSNFHASDSPFSYPHYLEDNLACALFAPVAAPAGASNPIRRELYAQACELLSRRGALARPCEFSAELSNPWLSASLLFLPQALPMGQALSLATAQALELALQDDSGKAFSRESAQALLPWIEKCKLSHAAAPASTAAKKTRI